MIESWVQVMKEFSQSAITPPIYSLHCDWINSHHQPGFTSLSVSHWGEKFSQIDATALLWYVTSLTQEQEKLLMWWLELMASLSSRIFLNYVNVHTSNLPHLRHDLLYASPKNGFLLWRGNNRKKTDPISGRSEESRVPSTAGQYKHNSNHCTEDTKGTQAYP